MQYHSQTASDPDFKSSEGIGYMGFSNVGFEGLLVAPSSTDSRTPPAFVPGSLVHELGHVFGAEFHSDDPRVKSYSREKRRGVRGFDVQMADKIVDKLEMVSIMESFFDGETMQDLWIDPFSYGAMLRYLKWPWYDPELVIMNGVMDKNGEFAMVDSINVTHGDLFAYPESEFKFVARSLEGEVILQNSLHPDFRMFAGGRMDPIGLEVAPVSLSFPNLPEIDSLEVSMAGFVTFRLDVKQRGLQAAIDHIPDVGFWVGSRKLIRIIRDQMIHRVEKYLYFKERRKKYQARKELWLLRRIVEKTIRDHYETEFPLDMEKSEVLSVINDTMASVKRWE